MRFINYIQQNECLYIYIYIYCFLNSNINLKLKGIHMIINCNIIYL